ncbi:GNAT family N-acetyltransferase [Jiella sp. M17.18]|uniref:GNAT family N-acetyltransferase n=1 Tax=Jiella sp. M17.18 TaxID=3234247 RepID=UPI0034DED882
MSPPSEAAAGFGPYRIMPRPVLCDGPLVLRAVDPPDIEPIRLWRNAQMDVLRQDAPIPPDGQRAYFAAQIWPQKPSLTPSTILLAIERDGVLIGYGGLVHVSWPDRRAEISFLLDPQIEADPGSRAEAFSTFLRLIRGLAFDDLSLNRIFTETYATRKAHIVTLESSGMIFEGRMIEHVVVDGRPTDSLVHGLVRSHVRKEGSR